MVEGKENKDMSTTINGRTTQTNFNNLSLCFNLHFARCIQVGNISTVTKRNKTKKKLSILVSCVVSMETEVSFHASSCAD